MTGSTITVLTSASGVYATKRIRQRRNTGKHIKTNYGHEKYFRVRTADLTGLAHLCRYFEALTRHSCAFMISGEPLTEIDLYNVRGLADDPEMGDAATFAEMRPWVAVDIDKVASPAAIRPVEDPDGAIEHLIGSLPPERGDARCWWLITSSQDPPGCEDTLWTRPGFWLTKPLDVPL
jgi:hypothetical protein